MNAVSWQCEVFYRRLINRVDDFGRFTANPLLLRASIFPLQLDRVRDSDIPRLLAESEKAGLLYVYAVAEKRYLVMNKWEKGRAGRSTYPDPPADIIQKMQTFVYKCRKKSANAPDSDSDTDANSDADNKAVELVPMPDCLMTSAFEAKWAEYVAYRKSNRMRALQPASVQKLWAEMAKWGHDAAIQSIEQTIRNSWQGLFEPKGKNGGAKEAGFA